MSHRLDFLGNIPNEIMVAVSGGPDSMAVLDFLRRGKKEVIAIHYDHGTEHGKEASKFVKEYCKREDVWLFDGHISGFRHRQKNESPEEFWRNARYDFFSRLKGPIITCHNLDDQVENWLFTSIRNGNPTLIPYRRDHIIRPFLLTKKAALEGWCERKNVPYLVDPGNSSDKHARSYIRTEIVPKALHINPGMHKMIKKKVLKEFECRQEFEKALEEFGDNS